MHNRKSYVRIGVRAVTGLAIVAATALTVTALTTADMPEVRGATPSVTVTTDSTSHSTIVCQGSFGALGLNPATPNEVTPVGEATTRVSSEEPERTELSQTLPAATPPTAFTTPVSDTVRAAQSQRVSIETIKGMTASACGEATNDQWLVGGNTVRGTSSVITLSNPGNVPATVTLSVFDENGAVTDIGTTGVLIPAGTQKSVPLTGFGTGRASTVVRVQTTGAPVFATLNMHQITEITPIGADTVNAQVGAATELVFPGVITYENHTHGEDEGSHPLATVRMLAPETATEARVFGVTPEGERIELAQMALEPGIVSDAELTQLPEQVTAIIVESDEPVVAGVMSVTHDNADYDFTWMAPSEIFEAGQSVRVPMLDGATLTVANVSDREATLTLGEDTVTLEVGAARTVSTSAITTVTSDAPFALGATLFDEQSLTTYPVLGTGQQIQGFTVYTR